MPVLAGTPASGVETPLRNCCPAAHRCQVGGGIFHLANGASSPVQAAGSMVLTEQGSEAVRNRAQTQVVVAEEMALVREGIAAICATLPWVSVVGQCGDGAQALKMIETLRPDIAVLDLNLPQLFTLELIRKCREAGLPTKHIVVATRDDRKTVLESLRGGAQAFVLKSGPSRHLLEALQQVAQGAVYVTPQLQINKIFASTSKKTPLDPLDSLSPREHQVFSLLVDGFRAKEIAARLDLSPKTVDTHRASLMRKLEIHDVAGLVKYAIQRKLTAAG